MKNKLCKYCGKEMRKDDEDFHFKGNTDIYWECDNCDGGCTEKIRYGKTWQEVWKKNYNSELEIVTYKIK